MRPLLLKIFLFVCVLASASSLGLGVQANMGYVSITDPAVPGNSISGGLGMDVGFLTPYLLDIIIGVSAGAVNDRMAVLSTYTLHYTAMLTRNFAIFTGLGLGLDAVWGVRFDQEKRNPYEVNHSGLITRALFPLGIKFFIDAPFECFAEVVFGIGMYQSWTKRYMTQIPSPSAISQDEYQRSFYWDVCGRVGLRYWY